VVLVVVLAVELVLELEVEAVLFHSLEVWHLSLAYLI
jgi:hypothetical protein